MKKKTTNVNIKYVVAIAEYDESGSDGLCICNALPFDTPEAAAQFIVDDFNDTMSYAEDMGVEYDELDLEQVTKKIMKLKPDESHLWKTPVDMPIETHWKVFAK